MESYTLTDTETTRLAGLVKKNLDMQDTDSAFLPLESGIDALAARLGLASAAQRSLDVQYYIWRGDTTGKAMAHALLQAADRGVRIRLLLDDLQASEHDPVLLAMDRHDSVEVRMFNPTAARNFRLFELLTRFAQLNRRMHNKLFIADNQLAIVGGRNIGDEYFSASPVVDFSDFDVLAAGHVVPQISRTFDLYWNSDLAVPIRVLHQGQQLLQLKTVSLELENAWQQFSTTAYADAIHESRTILELQNNRHRIYQGSARAVADAPEKLLNDPQDNSTHLGPQLTPMLDDIGHELLIISPYFVPGEELVRIFADLVSKGIRVTVITNSLASNDVGMVHAGYSKYRERLLASGVELYEFKPDPQQLNKHRKGSGIAGSSRASLHAKVFVIDRQTIFVGSMNLDPRSFHLNSELGIIIDSAAFADTLAVEIYQQLPQNAYRVYLAGEEDESAGTGLRWETIEQGQTVVYDDEPDVGLLRRMGIWFMSLFVSEELL